MYWIDIIIGFIGGFVQSTFGFLVLSYQYPTRDPPVSDSRLPIIHLTFFNQDL